MEKCYALKQREINKEIEQISRDVSKESFKSIGRLRNCKAWVYESEHYYVLQSYTTDIAVIDKRTGILYDCLRMVYGYTATSAQHIAKFGRDYGATSTLTWREA